MGESASTAEEDLLLKNFFAEVSEVERENEVNRLFAGFICEAIQGVGGIIELAPGYLPAVYSTIKKAGGLFIADQVQAGFARTCSHFWGFEAH